MITPVRECKLSKPPRKRLKQQFRQFSERGLSPLFKIGSILRRSSHTVQKTVAVIGKVLLRKASRFPEFIRGTIFGKVMEINDFTNAQ